MDMWDIYSHRASVHGATQRDATLKREIRMVNSKIPNSLSYHRVTIDGHEQEVVIVDSDNYNEKTLLSLPGEDVTHGGIVHWDDNYWLITEKDANSELRTKCKMIQCNYLLKWVSDDDVVREQWCIIEDGTKYLTGEFEDRNFVVTRGDSRIAMTISKNEYTVKFNRESRFIIDDPDSPIKLAYLLSKPLKLGGSYNGNGVFKFVLQEAVTTDNDNLELGIPDYYEHFPRDTSTNEPVEPKPSGKKGWL